MNWCADTPYNQLPLLPPESEQIETVAILKACIKARAALAELKQAGELLPNQGLLINLLPLLEAKDSCEIENIVTTTDKLFQFSDDEHNADPATKEALRYRTALREGFIDLRRRPLCTNTAIEVCSALKGSLMDIRRIPGTTIGNQATGETIYTPPIGEAVIRDLLGNWEEWILYVLKGVEETSRWTHQKIVAVRELMENTTAYIKQELPKIYSHELVQVLFEQPYCRIANLTDKNIVQRQTASNYLKQLADIGVVTEMTAGKEKLFVHSKLMRLMAQDDNRIQPYALRP